MNFAHRWKILIILTLLSGCGVCLKFSAKKSGSYIIDPECVSLKKHKGMKLNLLLIGQTKQGLILITKDFKVLQRPASESDNYDQLYLKNGTFVSLKEKWPKIVDDDRWPKLKSFIYSAFTIDDKQGTWLSFMSEVADPLLYNIDNNMADLGFVIHPQYRIVFISSSQSSIYYAIQEEDDKSLSITHYQFSDPVSLAESKTIRKMQEFRPLCYGKTDETTIHVEESRSSICQHPVRWQILQGFVQNKRFHLFGEISVYSFSVSFYSKPNTNTEVNKKNYSDFIVCNRNDGTTELLHPSDSYVKVDPLTVPPKHMQKNPGSIVRMNQSANNNKQSKASNFFEKLNWFHGLLIIIFLLVFIVFLFLLYQTLKPREKNLKDKSKTNDSSNTDDNDDDDEEGEKNKKDIKTVTNKTSKRIPSKVKRDKSNKKVTEDLKKPENKREPSAKSNNKKSRKPSSIGSRKKKPSSTESNKKKKPSSKTPATDQKPRKRSSRSSSRIRDNNNNRESSKVKAAASRAESSGRKPEKTNDLLILNIDPNKGNEGGAKIEINLDNINNNQNKMDQKKITV